MKKFEAQLILAGFLLASTIACRGEEFTVRYTVSYKGSIVATQAVRIAQTEDATTLACAFSANLPLFIASHFYSEALSVTFRADGTVEQFQSELRDGGAWSSVTGTLDADGTLCTVRTSMEGTSTNLFTREDYDFHSLIFYGRDPRDFLPPLSTVRVLSIANGDIHLIRVHANIESDTFERQHLVSTHLTWTQGALVSHSWHPERFGNLPRRYIRQTNQGEFVFNLIR